MYARPARTLALLPGLLCSLAVSSAHAITVDLDDVASGLLIDDEFTSANHPALAAGEGFTVSVQNLGGGPNEGTLYDTNLTGGEDDDLEGPPGSSWVGGNLSSPQTSAGNVLIIQESANATELANGQLTFANGPSGGGDFAPDDEAGGGSITLDFETHLTSFGFDWVDIDDVGGAGYSIDFIDSVVGVSVNLDFSEFVDSLSFFYDSSVTWGDSTANRIQPLDVVDLARELGEPTLVAFDQVRFNLSSSGGFSLIQYLLVPEPSGFALLAGGLLALGVARRRRSAGLR